MSIFQKALASFGIGAATVDTVLDHDTYTAGDLIQGNVHIKGGNVAQKIDAIYLSLDINFTNKSSDKSYEDTASILTKKITDPFTIEAGIEKTIPFSFNLPYDAPATFGRTKAWLHTGVDIKMAVDPNDKDAVTIRPAPLVSHLLTTIKELGFQLREVECEKAGLRMSTRHPFVQEYEFVPTADSFKGYLDELEVVFVKQSAKQIEVLFQIDRKARGFTSFLSEAFDMDESYVNYTFTMNDVESMPQIVETIIRKHMK